SARAASSARNRPGARSAGPDRAPGRRSRGRRRRRGSPSTWRGPSGRAAWAARPRTTCRRARRWRAWSRLRRGSSLLSRRSAQAEGRRRAPAPLVGKSRVPERAGGLTPGRRTCAGWVLPERSRGGGRGVVRARRPPPSSPEAVPEAHQDVVAAVLGLEVVAGFVLELGIGRRE